MVEKGSADVSDGTTFFICLQLYDTEFRGQQEFTVDNNSFNHLLGVILRLFSKYENFFVLFFPLATNFHPTQKKSIKDVTKATSLRYT